jgi:N-sulfoglucosamine sulfohydrolase
MKVHLICRPAALSRRLRLTTLCLIWILLAAVVAPSAVAAPARPNILFAFADDWGRHASAYARIDGPGTVNDLIHTPHFDRVAREGLLFRSAFVSAPSCTPCRSALLSGQHFWRTGRAAILQGGVWDGSQASYPLLLDSADYHIGKSYKVWSPGTPVDAPFGGQRFAFEKHGGRMNQFSQNATALVRQGKSSDAAKREILDEVRRNFTDFLDGRQPGQPFCFWFGPVNVHRKWIRGSGRTLWNLDPNALKGKMPPYLPDEPVVREDLSDYFGEAMAFDAALGVLLDKLEAIGELDNTLVVARSITMAIPARSARMVSTTRRRGTNVSTRKAGTKRRNISSSTTPPNAAWGVP